MTLEERASLVPVRPEVAELELSLLLEGIRRLSGYDFSDYAVVPLRRRISERLRAERVPTAAALLERILYEPDALARLVDALSTRSGELFADVALFRAVRAYVVRWLRTFPAVRAWVVGSAFDALALALIFLEEGLERPFRIYATEATSTAAERAKSTTLDASDLWSAERRYSEAGGKFELERYLLREGEAIRFKDEITRNLVISQHHLTTDGSFNEFQLVLAPHVTDAFAPAAAYRAHRTIYQSLVLFGIAYFGPAAPLAGTPHGRAYEPLAGYEGLFRRVR